MFWIYALLDFSFQLKAGGRFYSACDSDFTFDDKSVHGCLSVAYHFPMWVI